LPVVLTLFFSLFSAYDTEGGGFMGMDPPLRIEAVPKLQFLEQLP
jgi:hypothetical protein